MSTKNSTRHTEATQWVPRSSRKLKPGHDDAQPGGTDGDGARSLIERYRAVRRFSEVLCEPLVIEDYVVQSMPDASPTKWHLAHTSWFFETLVLSRYKSDYRPLDPIYQYLFNSYYNTLGPQFPRERRGVLSRPTVEDVYRYRAHVDEHMTEMLGEEPIREEVAQTVAVGLHHERQHQELMLTDIKNLFADNPLRPAYREAPSRPACTAPALQWKRIREGLYWIGHEGASFAYDNESPRHRVFLESVDIASRLVTNGEFIEFMADGGYDRPELWLSDGWKARSENGWTAPLYWEQRDKKRWLMTLGGLCALDPAEPVCHVSYFEADAYARWKEAWLPTEMAWEVACESAAPDGNFVESGRCHPAVAPRHSADDGITQAFGDVWEWTSSPYVPYPGYRPPEGPLGEYNAKFMANQIVLRGGSCVTSRTHARRTYRNFFPPGARWQFSGFRLAKEARA